MLQFLWTLASHDCKWLVERFTVKLKPIGAFQYKLVSVETSDGWSTYDNQMNKEQSNSKALKVLVIFNPLKEDATYSFSYLTWLYSKMMFKKEKVYHSNLWHFTWQIKF